MCPIHLFDCLTLCFLWLSREGSGSKVYRRKLYASSKTKGFSRTIDETAEPEGRSVKGQNGRQNLVQAAKDRKIHR